MDKIEKISSGVDKWATPYEAYIIALRQIKLKVYIVNCKKS
jgi:hypothetical protein